MSTVLTEPIYHVELIDGREIEKPLPKRFHARVQQRIQMELQKQIGNHLLEVLPALNVRCGEDRPVPDIVVASQNAHYDADDLIEGAYLATEVLSPGQTIGFLFDKADRMVRTGTKCCWIIWPARKQAWIYTADLLKEVHDVLMADGLVPLRIECSQLFAGLE
ncbi:MAG: Uma2 family endonuclease [Bryobacteraceae bacterium]